MSGTSNIIDGNCDRCGRPFQGKGYIGISGWKICGICQWEEPGKSTATKYITPEEHEKKVQDFIKMKLP